MLTICDVGPRDGLQNESVTLAPELRAELCDRLLAAGVGAIEAASFVNPRLVPQMAGAEEVVAAIHRRPGAVLSGLVLNERGLDRALAAGVDEVHYAFPVTDTFAQRNQNTTVEAGLATGLRLIERARALGLPYVYLGYWVPESRKMAYKSRFRPAEVLAGGTWRMLTDADLGSGVGTVDGTLVPESAD